MRRWNGWGDDTQTYEAPAGALHFLQQKVGVSQAPQAARLEDVLATVPPSRLPAHPWIVTAAQDRLLHARGQSLPDWLALRSGTIETFPDGVAYPTESEQVRQLLRLAAEHNWRLIPYGGGTSVVGHINPLAGEQPVLTVDLGRMNRLLRFDSESQLATFQAGVNGPFLEAQLRAHGCTLGHFPQSFEYATLGGWVATRSSGQQSLRYGRIEKLFAGGVLETPAGTLELPVFPASAAGPDLRELVLGSEGRLGILTEVTVRASRLPEVEEFHAIFLPNFEAGMAAARDLLQAGLPLAMLRLSTAVETQTTLALAGHELLIGGLQKLLDWRGLDDERCMLLVGVVGPRALMHTVLQAALALTRRRGGLHIGQLFGSQWHKNRFRSPYLRNTLWELGYAVDTLETATDWQTIPHLLPAIETALRQAIQPSGEAVHVFTHLSHLYAYGSSVYTTYLFRLADQPQETLRRWQAMKAAASQVIVAHKATISHQHGVGLDHRPYLAAEKGELGMQTLRSLTRLYDPQGLLNPGKLLE